MHKLDDGIERLAKIAARTDDREGGTRMAQNVLAMLAWSGGARRDHGQCAGFRVLVCEVDGEPEGWRVDEPYAIECEPHGRIDRPAWKGPE